MCVCVSMGDDATREIDASVKVALCLLLSFGSLLVQVLKDSKTIVRIERASESKSHL